jgi:hypothetical protein
MLIPSSKKTNSFLPIPTSERGGTPVANFNKQNKTASFQLQEAKDLHLPCQFQQANKQTWNQSVS